MRRGLSIFLLSLLFFSALAIAEEEGINGLTPEEAESILPLQDPPEDNLDNLLPEEEVTLEDLSDKAKSTTTKAIEKEITLPTKLQIPARIIFGIKDKETMSIERLIVLFAIWLVFFLVMVDLLKFSTFSDEVRWVVSFSMVVIMAVTGVINSLSSFAFGLGNSIKWMEGLGAIRIFLVIIVAAAIMFGVRLLTSKIEEKRLLEKAEDTGAAAGRFVAGAKKFEEEVNRNKKS